MREPLFHKDGGFGELHLTKSGSLFSSLSRTHVNSNDPEDTIRLYGNICANGNKYPNCGAGWWGIVPILGPAWDSRDAFRSGRWGWGIYYGSMAVLDLFLLKSLLTSAGKAVAKGAGELAAKEGVEVIKNPVVEWLGSDARTITNSAGDKIFLSKDGLRRVRFDFKNPAPHINPHMHVEQLINGKWVKSGQIYPVGVPPH